MRNIRTFKKFSTLGLMLLAISALASTFDQNNKKSFAGTGRCLDDDPGAGVQWTCTLAGTGPFNCDLTEPGHAATWVQLTDAPTASTTLDVSVSFCSNDTEDW